MATWEQYTADEAKNELLSRMGRDMVKSLCTWLGADFNESNLTDSEQSIKRRLYKDTGCGAWIHFDHERVGVEIGSIVEGSDAEVGPIFMQWPFTYPELEKTIELVESEASELWHEANTDPDSQN